MSYHRIHKEAHQSCLTVYWSILYSSHHALWDLTGSPPRPLKRPSEMDLRLTSQNVNVDQDLTLTRLPLVLEINRTHPALS